MIDLSFQMTAGIMICLIVLGLAISQIGIAKTFHYPQILQQPIPAVLAEYHKCRDKIRPFWALFAFSSLMVIALAGIFYQFLNRTNTPYLLVGTFFGVAAGIFYALGIMRWVLLADHLALKYVQAADDSKTKETIEHLFEAFHIYCGNSIGETMGFFCMGVWIFLVGLAMLDSKLFPWEMGLGLMVSGIGIGMAPFEWVGFKQTNLINKIAMKVLMVLLLGSGAILISNKY